MRIAYLGLKGLPSKSGAERVAEAVVRRLAGRHQVVVYCNSRYTPADVQIPGMRLVRVPTLPGRYLQPVSLFVLSALHALCCGHYDLIHMHNVEASFVLPILRLRYQVIVTSHGPAYARAKWGPLAKALLRANDWLWAMMATKMTAVSKPQAAAYQKRLRREVLYIPNGVEVAGSMVERLGESADKVMRGLPASFVLCAAKRLDPTKGCHLLLDAHAKLQSPLPLVIVGDFVGPPAYEREVRRMLGANVTLMPAIDEPDLFFRLVKRAHLFVLPSTVEATSMMLLEAASLGVPLIASDIPENLAVLPPSVVTFRSGSSEDLADRLAWALAHPDEMAAIARRVQAWVTERSSWSSIVDEYDNLYHSVASARASHSG